MLCSLLVPSLSLSSFSSALSWVASLSPPPSFPCSLFVLLLLLFVVFPLEALLCIDSLKHEFAFYDLVVLMERSRSPRRYSSRASCPNPHVILPVQNSSMATFTGPSWYPAEGMGLAGVIPPRPPPAPTWGQPGHTILLGQRWKSNLEFYDYQKVNGLPLPRLIRPSVWSQNMNIAGFDPLT